MLHPRARTMLLLSLPAVAIGIASSLILIVVMKIASALQNLLWQRLPGTLGIARDSPLWIIGVLTLTGIAVGLVIRFSQGHAGPDPACEPLIGAPVPPSALPGTYRSINSRSCWRRQPGAGTSDHDRQYRPCGCHWRSSVTARQPNGVDYFSLCRNHRRAVWYTCCGGVDIFANLKWQ